MRLYTVYADFVAVQVFHVEADSPEAAIRQVNSGELEPFETLDSGYENIEVEEDKTQKGESL